MMMDCNIDIRGVGNGEYAYTHLLGTDFFESFGADIIVGADVKADFLLKKSGDWMGIDMKISGNVVVECDRCLGDLPFPVDVEGSFTVKFFASLDEAEYGEEVIALHQSETMLRMGQVVYDYICLELPIRMVHEEGECDPEVIGRLSELRVEIDETEEEE